MKQRLCFIIILCSLVSITYTQQIKKKSTELISWNPNFSVLPRRCKVKTISTSPYILLIENFLSEKESKLLKAVAKPLLERSCVVSDENPKSVSDDRTSNSAFLEKDESQKDLLPIKKRAAYFLNKKIKDVEGIQVVHYVNGQKFNPHYDYFDRSIKSGIEAIEEAGQRIATFFVYLNDLDTQAIGGETYFPKVLNGLKIKPKKNMAVFWFNVYPNGKEDDRTLHAGLPINRGEKWGTNIWIRDIRIK